MELLQDTTNHQDHTKSAADYILAEKHFWSRRIDCTSLVKQIFDDMTRGQDNHDLGSEDKRVYWAVDGE